MTPGQSAHSNSSGSVGLGLLHNLEFRTVLTMTCLGNVKLLLHPTHGNYAALALSALLIGSPSWWTALGGHHVIPPHWVN